MLVILLFRHGKRNCLEKTPSGIPELRKCRWYSAARRVRNWILYYCVRAVTSADQWHTRQLAEKEGSSYIRGTGWVFWERSDKRTPLLLTEIWSEVQGRATDTRNKITFRKRKHKLACNTGKAGSSAVLRQREVRWAKTPGLKNVTKKNHYSGDQVRFSAWTRTWTSKHITADRETSHRALQDWSTTASLCGRKKQVLRTQFSLWAWNLEKNWFSSNWVSI